jgi:hypothetical protein
MLVVLLPTHILRVIDLYLRGVEDKRQDGCREEDSFNSG